jgi:hypothetical protein
MNESSRNKTKSLAHLSIALSSSVMGPSMACCHVFQIETMHLSWTLNYVVC